MGEKLRVGNAVYCWNSIWDSNYNLVEFKLIHCMGFSMKNEYDVLRILEQKDHRYYKKAALAKTRHQKALKININ